MADMQARRPACNRSLALHLYPSSDFRFLSMPHSVTLTGAVSGVRAVAGPRGFEELYEHGAVMSRMNWDAIRRRRAGSQEVAPHANEPPPPHIEPPPYDDAVQPERRTIYKVLERRVTLSASKVRIGMRIDLSEIGFSAGIITEQSRGENGEIWLRFVNEKNRLEKGGAFFAKDRSFERIIRGIAVEKGWSVS